MNRFAPYWRATLTRSSRRRNTSLSRVRWTTKRPPCSSRAFSSLAKDSVTVFSSVPLTPSAPLSMPPWPGSMTMVKGFGASAAPEWTTRSPFGVDWVEPVVAIWSASAAWKAFSVEATRSTIIL